MTIPPVNLLAHETILVHADTQRTYIDGTEGLASEDIPFLPIAKECLPATILLVDFFPRQTLVLQPNQEVVVVSCEGESP